MPPAKVRDVLVRLREHGWVLKGVKGSHHHFGHPERPGKVTIAYSHEGEEIPPETLRSISRQAGLDEMKYAVVIERGESGWGAYVPDLLGCVAVGPTAEWVEREIEGAIAMHLAGMRESGDTIPEPTTRAIVVDAA